MASLPRVREPRVARERGRSRPSLGRPRAAVAAKRRNSQEHDLSVPLLLRRQDGKGKGKGSEGKGPGSPGKGKGE